MKYLVLSIIFFLTSCTVQQSGITFPNQNPISFNTSKNEIQSSINDFKITDDLNPLTIQVNVIVLKRDDGTGNYDLKNAEEKNRLELYMNQINVIWSQFYQPQDLNGCYSGTDFYKDSKIRFKFNYIEIKDTYAWNYRNSGADLEKQKYSGITPYDGWHLTYLDKKLANDPKTPKGINLYLTMDGNNFDRLYKSKGENYNLKWH